MAAWIDTDAVSARYRAQAIDLEHQRLLVTNFRGTEQEQDLSEPPNCEGFGRLRHFRRVTCAGWPANPLPIDPACKALGLSMPDALRAQVFQNAVCNWRCWYCFVPFNLLAANLKYAAWLSPARLIDLYLNQSDPPAVLDLTGGQPDLVPEWIPWMMTELRARGLERHVYLWSDDNLSTDYFWRFLSDADRELVATYPTYGRVCCFKGFNAASFAFNTRAEPALFERQFVLMQRLLTLGMDLYAYATFTTPSRPKIPEDMARFVDRLQELDEHLPLRLVPLEIREFTPVKSRQNELTQAALTHQHLAVEAWQKELEGRYSSVQRALSMVDIPLRQGGGRL
jgi:uncharacterized Fe-S cluster-containing radical SAM superfamily protein